MAHIIGAGDQLMQDAATTTFNMTLLALTQSMPEDGILTEEQAVGAMLGLVAALCSFTARSSTALNKPLGVAKGELLAAIEDHWPQAVANLALAGVDLIRAH